VSDLSPDARAATRGGLALAVLQTVARLLGFVFAVVATHEVAPDQFGRYSIVAALLLIGGFVADFGTTTVITREVSADASRSDPLLTHTLAASLALGLVAYGGIVVFVLVAGYPHVTVVDTLLGGLALPCDAVLTSVLGALDGHGLVARRAVLSFLRVAIITGAGALALVAGLGVRSAIVTMAVGPAVGLGVSVVVARAANVWRGRVRPAYAPARDLIRRAVPFALLGSINVLILRFDVVLLSLLSSRGETAAYDLTLRIIEGLSYLGPVIVAPALFILSRRLATGDVAGADRAYREATRVLYLASLPLSVGIVALHEPLVRLFFGARYAASEVPLAILGAQLWLSFVSSIQGTILIAGGETRRAILRAGLVAAITVALDVAVIPAHGARGAASVLIVTEVATVLSFGELIWRRWRIATPIPPLGAIAAAAGCGVAAWLLRDYLALAVLAGAVVYGGGLLLTGTVDRRDLTRLRAAVLRRGAPPG
jgi:O-antigen/teichoic acid export membrane protein